MKPILFNTQMVQAILDGRKTVTRRNPFQFEMKDGYNPEWSGYSLGEYYTGRIETGVCLYSRGVHGVWGVRSNVVKLKYQAGDILYVRETWHKYKKRVGQGFSCRIEEFYGYKASVKNSEDANELWKPSIHMPKEAARIFLRVTDVRAERLNSISKKEIHKEGTNNECKSCISGDCGNCNYIQSLIDAYETLWNSTIKKKDVEKYGWDANPWVWVIEFERVSKEVAYEKL